MRRRNFEAAQRFADRRQREDDAPRLATAVPRLQALRLEVEERRSGVSSAESTHIRRIVVDAAPALFVLPCHDERCRDGGHDVTSVVMHALRAGQPQFEGEDACPGLVGSALCQRVLRYVGIAEYRD
jgi:hypothetical protein